MRKLGVAGRETRRSNELIKQNPGNVWDMVLRDILAPPGLMNCSYLSGAEVRITPQVTAR